MSVDSNFFINCNLLPHTEQFVHDSLHVISDSVELTVKFPKNN